MGAAMTHSSMLKTTLLLALAMAFAAPASAADDKKAAQAQVRQLQQAQRKLEQEKAQLAAEKTTVDGELKDTKDKLDEAKRGTEAVTRRRAALEKELSAAASEKAALKTQLTELEAKLADAGKKQADTTAVLRKTEEAKAAVEATLTQRSQTLATVEAKNDTQHKLSMEILEKYQQKGCTTSLLQREPLIGLKQVEIENFTESYREKLDQVHLVPVAAR
jgi:chromosome segregation ATPase